MNTFEDKLAQILEVESIRPTDSLKDYPSWDSLAILTTIAMAESEFGVVLSGPELAGAKTVGDVWNIIDSIRCSRL